MNFDTQSKGMVVLHRFNLFKRLESSVFSFAETLRRLLEKIDNTIHRLEHDRTINEEKGDFTDEEYPYLEGKYEIEVKHVRIADYVNDLSYDKMILEQIYKEAN